LLEKIVQWTEFIAVRSSEDLQQRISARGPITTVSHLTALVQRERSSKEKFLAIRPSVRSRPALFLSRADASRHTGLSQAFLKRKIGCGELAAIKDGAWKIRRSDLHEN
jgi:hypothetical protein